MIERLQLLMIDDDLVDRLAIRRAIEQSGLVAEIDEASDAEEALTKVSKRSYDCLLLDHDLPTTSGIEVNTPITTVINAKMIGYHRPK